MPRALSVLKNVAAFALAMAACTSTVAPSALALGEPNNSKVEVTTKSTPKGLELVFKVLPNEGLVVTLDAPWKLEVKKADGLTLPKTSFAKGDMDDKIPGFVVTTSEAPKGKSGDVEYQLTSFVCTKDKTACYREVHKGTYGWKS